jgi:ADP-heptose:LPS heptosyltransferase
MLVGPKGAQAARLLPGVDDVLVWECPWIAAAPAPVERADVADVVRRISSAALDEALILTSFHQSALPTALLLRLAGVRRITAVSEDYPGSLLDVRVAPPAEAPEPVRMLEIAAAAGYPEPADGGTALAVRIERLPQLDLPDPGFVVVHPGADAPAREYPARSWRRVVELLTAAGHTVMVTGSSTETELTSEVASTARLPGRAIDLGARLDVAALAAVLRSASVLLAGNTGPAHLAAAVGTPVVSLFAPVVSATRWAPYGVASIVLGDQQAACAATRARTCPVAGHPCLATVPPAAVVAAAEQFAARSAVVAPSSAEVSA